MRVVHINEGLDAAPKKISDLKTTHECLVRYRDSLVAVVVDPERFSPSAMYVQIGIHWFPVDQIELVEVLRELPKLSPPSRWKRALQRLVPWITKL